MKKWLIYVFRDYKENVDILSPTHVYFKKTISTQLRYAVRWIAETVDGNNIDDNKK